MSKLTYEAGTKISWRGEGYQIRRVVSMYNLLACHLVNSTLHNIPVAEAQPYIEPTGKKVEVRDIDLSLVTKEQMDEAERRFKIIEPLIQRGFKRTRSAVELIAKENKLSTATLYRWLSYYEQNERLTSLIPRERSDKGESRIDPEQDAIVRLCIQEKYLTDQRPSLTKGYMDYKLRCKAAGVPPCSESTFARRVEEISPQEIAKKRLGPKTAREKFDPATGEFPAGNFPYHAIQIDHTKPNVMLVDDDHRKPIGRPWVTFAIDIFSRVIPGFHLSLAPPSATAVGLCLSQAMMRKEKWLALRNIEAEWPTWGIFDSVYADNGPDFRCKSVNLACSEHHVGIRWRPLGRPEYGGHVERLMKTVKTDLSNLRGTTFMNPEDKGEYDSEGNAIFTFSEFERWLTVYILKYYHMRRHDGIGMPPLKKFEEGIFIGSANAPPTGLPDPVQDERRLYLDFLPFVSRTVQRYGAEYDYIRYFHPSISKWIGVKSPSTPDGKHIFKYEDHQVNFVYFLDPETKDYLEIPRVRRSHQNVTRHEWSQARKLLEARGVEMIDEEALIRAVEELNAIEVEAEVKTKAARRSKQRKKESARAVSHVTPSKADVETISDISPFTNNPVTIIDEFSL